MGLSTYDDLKNAVIRQSRRGDLADLLDDAIILAEVYIRSGGRDGKGLELRKNEHRSTTTMKKDDRFVPLPEHYKTMRSLKLFDGSAPRDLYFVVNEALKIRSYSGKPYFYTINHQLEFDRVPDKNYTLEMTYYKNLVPLSETNQTNDVMTKYPNLYLLGTLAASFRMVRDEATADYYDQLFLDELSSANRAEKLGRYGPAPTMKTEGSTP